MSLTDNSDYKDTVTTVPDSLAHAALDTESQILCHVSSLDRLNAHSFKVVSKCGQVLVVCTQGRITIIY